MMNQQQLSKIENALEGFFQKVRFNVILHQVLVSDEYLDFEKVMANALKRQIIYFATVQQIDVVLLTQKQDDAIEAAVEKNWLSLDNFFDVTLLALFLSEVANQSGQGLLNQMNSTNKFEIDKKLQGKIDRRAVKAVELIDGTSMQWIAQAIARGKYNGQSAYEIAKDIHRSADEIATFRASVIAENEAASLLGVMTLDIMEQNKVQYKRLITSRDEIVCPLCNGDEQAGEIELADEFPSGALTTPIHIGCRCFILPS